MSELISGKEALKAISDGEVVEIWFNSTDGWHEIKTKDAYSFDLFLDQQQIRFRIKPRTITLNGIEVPACGHDYQYGNAMYILNSLEPEEYSMVVLDQVDEVPAYWWRTEAEVKQVVAALRSIFK